MRAWWKRRRWRDRLLVDALRDHDTVRVRFLNMLCREMERQGRVVSDTRELTVADLHAAHANNPCIYWSQFGAKCRAVARELGVDDTERHPYA